MTVKLRVVRELIDERDRLVEGDVEVSGGGPHDPTMEKRLSAIEAIIPTLATKADVESLRADLHKMDASTVRWMIATILTLFLGFAGLFFTMQTSINAGLDRATKPAVQPPDRALPAPQPIIIHVPATPAAPQPSPAPLPSSPSR